MSKKLTHVVLALIAVGAIVIPAGLSANAEQSMGSTLCADWSTKQVKFSNSWSRCPSKSSPLDLSSISTPGPKGDVGQAGPAGPAGPAGSSFDLTSYPALALDNSLIQAEPCENDRRWSAIIHRYGFANIERDLFGQPVRHKIWATALANGCDYPYDYIFENPKVTSFSNLVVGAKYRFTYATGPSADYSRFVGWKVPITSLDIDVSLDPGWHLCTNADVQFSALSLSTTQAPWSAIDSDTFRWVGQSVLTWEKLSPDPSDKPSFFGEEGNLKLPYFCGPSSEAASGLLATRLAHGELQYLVPKPFSDFN